MVVSFSRVVKSPGDYPLLRRGPGAYSLKTSAGFWTLLREQTFRFLKLEAYSVKRSSGFWSLELTP